ncbi:UDP-2,4-diacetamido-2,4,6-trideoxy-beta-L-altropyranose hydrolase [Polaromonas sp.]|uniref:UDP-2,4-diacetamido-2,4, 6-trideoxy-beta-L-altropyranose hydrolase n=1 Tax=Polaromonas sp. TaxID=1869339 RepID=UPI0018235DEA|nr:UDP-2,4-diacetamido-2,4,6-trideoxy-beta-L-altropyranose hydrolase [Polaromonas sp.]NML86969.1 UDP-2,4-diacetamido-2,4,6-trideoxy-beta-L-altropyranose hydrolase [Polaromonas sp.]
MKIAFRADASLQMGSGHVMRCLTLADALKAQGADCHFISREHPGHLLEVIRQRGYKVNSLVAPVQPAQEAIKKIVKEAPSQQREPVHAAWLGSTWQNDAQETAAILASLQPDWLVVDHYALDQRWEEALAPHYRQLLVIDDLADRPHRCDLILDQNLGSQPEHYSSLVPAHCQVLTGPHYALLRPEFAALRPYSLQRRQAQPALRQLLITMGGVDQPNATGKVLQALKTCALPADCRITVVMGLTAPWLQNVRELAAQMPWPTEVVVNVSDMAQRMADSDLAIGAAGSTSWERCCLGLPTLMVVLAENQQPSAQALEAAHAARLIGGVSDIATQLPLAAAELIDSDCQSQMSLAASAITNGQGVEKILNAMGVLNA